MLALSSISKSKTTERTRVFSILQSPPWEARPSGDPYVTTSRGWSLKLCRSEMTEMLNKSALGKRTWQCPCSGPCERVSIARGDYSLIQWCNIGRKKINHFISRFKVFEYWHFKLYMYKIPNSILQNFFSPKYSLSNNGETVS